MGFPKKASNRLRAAKSARKLSADFTNRRESGRQTAGLYEFPGVSRPAKLPAMRTAGEGAKPSAPPIFRPAGRAQSGRHVWNGYGGKPPPFGSPRARQRAHSVRWKRKSGPAPPETACLHASCLLLERRSTYTSPPLISQKSSKTKRRPSEWTASEATGFERFPARR